MLSQIATQILCRISSVTWLQQFNCNGIWSRCSAIGNLKNISFYFLLHLWWFPFDYVKLFYDFIFFIKELFTVLFPSLTHWLWVCEFLPLLSLMAIIIGWNELPGFPLFEKRPIVCLITSSLPVLHKKCPILLLCLFVNLLAPAFWVVYTCPLILFWLFFFRTVD